MNRTNLLATSAVVALVLATGTSIAQQERGAPPPAEKMAPSGAKQPSAVKHQNNEGQNTPAGHNERLDGRTGEAPQNHGRAETTGQAPREDRLNERTTEPKRGETEDRRGRTTEENRPAGQAPREDGGSRASRQDPFAQEPGKADREENRATIGRDTARTNMNMTPEKRARIHETIIHERNVPRVSAANFDVSIGTRVPRGVRFASLPPTIVEIEPSWRGFEYFMIRDEIVIVDPGSLEIVAILDA
jgi:Protein of unknown function (DUF1236)